MKFHHDATTITIYFLLVLLWMALFTNASEEENEFIDFQALDNSDISQKTLEILANMKKDHLYDIIQALHKKRSLAQPTMPNAEKKTMAQSILPYTAFNMGNKIMAQSILPYTAFTDMGNANTAIVMGNNINFAKETNRWKHMIMNYLTIRDIIGFGFTCRALYVKVFEHDQTGTLRKFCNVDIPAHMVPHLKFLLEETPENLIAIKVIHHIKRLSSGYCLNGDERMLKWQNYDTFYTGIISTTYGEGTVVHFSRFKSFRE